MRVLFYSGGGGGPGGGRRAGLAHQGYNPTPLPRVPSPPPAPTPPEAVVLDRIARGGREGSRGHRTLQVEAEAEGAHGVGGRRVGGASAGGQVQPAENVKACEYSI
jgi:hypothetical protein